MGFKNLVSSSSAVEAVQPDDIVISQIGDLLSESKRGICYVSQDNYIVTYFDAFSDKLKLYADSATSCIIVIVTGRDEKGKSMIAMSHLSKPVCFWNFFYIVNKCFRGEIKVYASGANPPDPIMTKSGMDYTAFINANMVIDWVHDYRKGVDGLPPPAKQGNIQIVDASLSFGQGDPSVYNNNLDCFGIQLKDMTVTHDREWLADIERDETRGVQTLFCVFADVIRPQVPFTKEYISALVRAAKKDGRLYDVPSMTDEKILQTFSTTPAFEVPWFCDNIRAAAAYVEAHPV